MGAVRSNYQGDFGPVVAGIDSLKISAVTSLEKLGGILKKSLNRFESKDYLKSVNDRASAFAWVDNLQAVSDPVMKEALDQELWKRFENNSFENIFLAIPELVEWETVAGFAYTESQANRTDSLVNNLDIAELKASLRSGSDMNTLKHRQIFMVMSTTDYKRKFSVYRCLYAEMKLGLDSFLYILTSGNWFRVEPSFESQIENHFNGIPLMTFASPFIEYDHDGEGSYNDAIAASPGKEYILLDRKLIQFGGNHSSIEVCDLYKAKPPGKHLGELVHVKRGRESSSLSHLFAQGLVSSTLLASEDNFIVEVNKQIAKQGGIVFPSKMATKDYDVVFAIIDGSVGAKLEIPFFSKVNLQNCARSIRAYGFGIRFLHIPESAAYLARKKAAKVRKTQ